MLDEGKVVWLTRSTQDTKGDGRMQLTYMSAGDTGRPVAIVTGVSRPQGIGASVTRALAASGVAVLATGWRPFDVTVESVTDEEPPEKLIERIAGAGGVAEWVEADLADPQNLSGLFDEAERRFGSISILVNNAAYSRNDGWQALTPELLDAHYRINIRATALLTAEFAHRWPGGEGGRVINLTSGQFKGPMLGEIAYASSKGAVDAMTITMAAELAALGITVNAVGPGPTDTGWMSDEIRRELLPKHPSGRLGAPDDVARLIAFLASEQAQWVTGQIIHTEGGFLRR
jgi:3-oxoacyl-[acyl-carrier protein] reductase